MSEWNPFASFLVVIRGAGEMASAVGLCLHSVGFPVVMTETERPLAIRRAVSFSDAVFDGQASVEGVAARRAGSADEARAILAAGAIAVRVDAAGQSIAELRPAIVVDAIIAKRNLGTRLSDAPIVIALGPGFVAGRDAHAVIETNRGHDLGRIVWDGAAQPDTGEPAPVLGHSVDRVLRAPAAGVVRWQRHIGDCVAAGALLGEVAGAPITAPFAGVLRGALRDGLEVSAGLKIGDVDPRNEPRACFTVSDKARAIAGATLQAILILLRRTAEPRRP